MMRLSPRNRKMLLYVGFFIIAAGSYSIAQQVGLGVFQQDASLPRLIGPAVQLSTLTWRNLGPGVVFSKNIISAPTTFEWRAKGKPKAAVKFCRKFNGAVIGCFTMSTASSSGADGTWTYRQAFYAASVGKWEEWVMIGGVSSNHAAFQIVTSPEI